jgi:hypothetical protein
MDMHTTAANMLVDSQTSAKAMAAAALQEQLVQLLLLFYQQ